MRLNRNLILLAGIAMAAGVQASGDIGPGSPAPALDVKTWYKGTPVKALEKDKTYVVEFWATWCGPCIQSIPHVSELAKKNPDVTFIGVSIWEEDEGTKIKDFVAKMGDQMSYNVGYSGNKTGMAETWMDAAAQAGIPSAFIVKNGVIQWVGHPMEMDAPLAQVKAGTFDLAAFKAEFDKAAAATRTQMAVRNEMTSVSKLIADGNYSQAKAKLGELESKYPTMKLSFESMRFTMLAKEDPAAWTAKAKALAAAKNEANNQMLANFAMVQTQKGGNVAQGTTAMNLALGNASEKDVLMFYNGAEYFTRIGDNKTALGWADKAVAALPNSQFKDSAEAKAAITKLRDTIAAKVKAG